MKFLIIFIFLLLSISTVSGFDFFGLFKSGGSSKKPATKDFAPVSDDKAKDYLQKFGYVEPSHVLASSSGLAGDFQDVRSAFKSAIRKFQEFAGLNPTGELDLKTKKKMAQPRCGVTDVAAITSGREAAFKWKKQHLTYSIQSFSPDLPHDDIKQAMRRAFDTWSAVVPLDFTEVSSRDESADIKIQFASSSHGDPWPFDGKGGVLAHATMPTSGLLHFDEDERWTFMNPTKIANGETDLYAVAIHESGHTLGLDHSRDEESIMAPFYHETIDSSGNYVEPRLKPSDIRDIQDIYGARSGGSSGGFRSTTERSTTRSSFPRGDEWGSWGGSDSGLGGRNRGSDWGSWGGSDSGFGSGRDRDRGSSSNWGSWTSWSDFGSSSTGRTRAPSRGGGSEWSSWDGDSTIGIGPGGSCPSRLDAICDGPSNSNYIFSGGNVYQFQNGRITKSHSLKLLFPKGPVYVDAAIANDRTSSLLLFQGYNVYSFHFTNNKWILDGAFPKRVPQNIGFRPNGGIYWIDGHQVLFSDDGRFAIYDEYWNEATKIDQISNYFNDFPKSVKGGFVSRGSEVKLFSSNRVYTYDGSRKIGIGQPQSLTSFFNC